ncbi:MAG TPA: hypothetical protein VGO21_05985, partial [Candidatus Paceibacterota bacterium]|nr:hypothetical protein [Candidatus Paceibacterota bacterium]
TCSKTEVQNLFDQILSTFQFTTPIAIKHISTCKADENIPPVISSLSNYSAAIGDKITIHGCNLNGFEGDKNVWIENKDGVKGILYGMRDTNNENLQVTLTSPVCEKDISYSGSPCDKWLTLAPGIYKMYVIPWAKKSNEVSITIK